MKKIMIAGLLLCTACINFCYAENSRNIENKSAGKGETMNSIDARTDWMANGSYGLMVHYLITPSGSSDDEKTSDLNRIIDGFDIDYFMQQFEKSKADWLIFTIGQNTGYYNNPNSVIDELIPGRTPKRALIEEIAKRVKGLEKRFIAYLPAEMWMQQNDMQSAFQWNVDDQTEFLKTYLSFLEDYSKRLGNNCDGWWIDGCYESIHKGKWNWEDWMKAARSGNPNSIIALNDGAFCVGILKAVSPLADYFSGEVHLLEDCKIRIDPIVGGNAYINDEGKIRRPNQEPLFHMPTSRFIDGLQWHALVPVDSSFLGDIIPSSLTDYSPELLYNFINKCSRVKGAVTLNLPIGIDGHIPDHSAEKVEKLGKLLDAREFVK